MSAPIMAASSFATFAVVPCALKYVIRVFINTSSYPRTNGALYSALISRISFKPSIYGW